MTRKNMKILAKIFSGFLLLTGTAHAAAFQFGGVRLDTTAITSAAGTTTLTKASTQIQRVTGLTTQTVKLPNCTTLQAGYWYAVANESTGTVTVQNSSSSSLTTLAQGEWAIFSVTSAASADNWSTMKAVPTGSSGGANLNVTTCLGSCTAAASDDVIWVTSTGTVTLRAATSTRALYVLSLATTTNIVPAGSDTILYDNMLTLNGYGQSVILISNGGTTWGIW